MRSSARSIARSSPFGSYGFDLALFLFALALEFLGAGRRIGRGLGAGLRGDREQRAQEH